MRSGSTRAEFARLAGVSGTAITKACRAGLAEALVGRRIDLDHPVAVAYLRSKGVFGDAPRQEASTPRAPISPETPRPTDAPTSIEGLEHFTLHELLARCGTVTGFKDWLDARKKIADTRKKDLKNEETVGRLCVPEQ